MNPTQTCLYVNYFPTSDYGPHQMEASDNGYGGAGGAQTASFSIQVAVIAINDAPVVFAPPPGTAVPGETRPFPGFLVMDPDTDIDGKLAARMLKVR